MTEYERYDEYSEEEWLMRCIGILQSRRILDIPNSGYSITEKSMKVFIDGN